MKCIYCGNEDFDKIDADVDITVYGCTHCGAMVTVYEQDRESHWEEGEING